MNTTVATIVTNPLAPVAPRPEQRGMSTTGGNALAAAAEQRAIAEIQTRHLMAVRFPRDQRRAVDQIITAFARPTLATRAQYEYPRGGETVRGPSIRAAEAIAQIWGHLEFGFTEITRFQDESGVGVSAMRASAVDLQSNTHRIAEFFVRHWRDTSSGGYRLSGERDIYELTANQAQRRVRACILALIPTDVVETAMKQADEAVKSTVEVTPATIAAITASFAKLGATRKMLEARFQRNIDTISPGQYIQLRRIYAAIRDGESDVTDWFPEAAQSDPAQAEANPGAEALNAKHRDQATNSYADAPRQRRPRRTAAATVAEDAPPASNPAPDADPATIDQPGADQAATDATPVLADSEAPPAGTDTDAGPSENPPHD